MATTSARLLDRSTLSSGDTMPAESASDMGEGQTLEVIVTVHAACEGDAPTLVLKHAPGNTDQDWLDFPQPIRVPLGRAGRTWFHAPYFTRYVGWSLSGTLDSSAEVTVELLAKG